MFINRRRRSGRDRLLPAKVVTLLIGGVLAAVGMSAGNSTLVNVAIAVVLVGFLLRFWPHPRDPADQPESAPPGDVPPNG